MTMTSSPRSFVQLFISIVATFSICLLPSISFCSKMQNSGPAAVLVTYNFAVVPEKHRESWSGCCSRSIPEKTIAEWWWCWVMCRERIGDSGVIAPPLCHRQRRLLLFVLASKKLRRPMNEGEWKIWNSKIQNSMPNKLKWQVSYENVWCGSLAKICPPIWTTALREKVIWLEALQNCFEGPFANSLIEKWNRKIVL